MTFLLQTMRTITPHIVLCSLNIANVLIKLVNAAETLLQWFTDNRMKANPEKYNLHMDNTKEIFQIKIGNETVGNRN